MSRTLLRLKYTCEAPRAGSWGEEPTGSTDTVPCVRVADFDRDNFRLKTGPLTLRDVPRRDRERGLLKKGDLLIEKSGGGEHQPVGAVAQYDRDEPAVSSNFLARIRAREGFHARFLTYVHASLYSARLTAKSAKQTTGIQNLDLDSYLNEQFEFPSYEAQRSIADALDAKTAQIDDLIAKKLELIKLLEEMRSALITAAVTGQIDLGEHEEEKEALA